VDDPQDVEDAESPTVAESDWSWFLSDVVFLGQHTRIFLIGNNLGEKCIIERIFANEGKLESVKFKTMRVPELTPEGASAWPAKKSAERILAEKEDFRRMGKLDIWLREKMCQAVGSETRVFDPADYRYYTAATIDKLMEGTNRYAVLDPASSTEKSACYRAIVVAGCNADNYWHIADVPFGRWDSAELIDRMFDTVIRWEIKTFGIEKGHFKQVIEPFIYKEMARRNVFFNIVPIEHGKIGSKLERIKMLQPRFKAHLIWFPDSAPWLAELESELSGVTKDAIKSLYIDLVDAMAMLEQVAHRPVNTRSRSFQNLPRTTVPETALI
jgi:predicted phage terminase large subunit-like protein